MSKRRTTDSVGTDRNRDSRVSVPLTRMSKRRTSTKPNHHSRDHQRGFQSPDEDEQNAGLEWDGREYEFSGERVFSPPDEDEQTPDSSGMAGSTSFRENVFQSPDEDEQTPDQWFP